MMKQYEDAKAASGDAILFFRMGYFYELFHDDAKTSGPRFRADPNQRDKWGKTNPNGRLPSPSA